MFPRKLTFGHRFRNLLTSFDHYFFDEGISLEEYRFLKRKFPDFPTPTQLFMKLAYVFRNSNEIIGAVRPESMKTKFIGGITMNRVKSEMTEVHINYKIFEVFSCLGSCQHFE